MIRVACVKGSGKKGLQSGPCWDAWDDNDDAMDAT